MNRVRTAVIVRAEDGVFQPMLLKPLAGGRNTSVYRLTGCVLRRIGPDGDGPAILSLTKLNEDAFVFVNIPLETANHMFLQALVDTVMLRDCGIASGVLIDQGRKILDSGLEATPGGELKDIYAGTLFRPHTLNDVRAVNKLAPYFFAVRRERFGGVGGLGILSSRRMMELLERLSTAAQSAGEQLLVTPHAIATLTGQLPK
jgi:hypothetical protein